MRIYAQVGARYKIPWEVLAGIGTEECDNGQFPAPSCTPIAGARGPGVANFAGASASNVCEVDDDEVAEALALHEPAEEEKHLRVYLAGAPRAVPATSRVVRSWPRSLWALAVDA
ncbi:MAG TPA: hypothetical protein VGL78_00930, partial [Solirubrobacteraceae bacterium]